MKIARLLKISVVAGATLGLSQKMTVGSSPWRPDCFFRQRQEGN